MRFRQFALDPKKRDEGQWVPFFDTGVTFQIASTFKPAYVAARSPAAIRARNRIEALGLRSDDVENEAVKREFYKELVPLFADHLLVGWSGLKDYAGNEVSYSKEVAIELMNDPIGGYEVCEFVSVQAGSFARYAYSNEGAAAKN